MDDLYQCQINCSIIVVSCQKLSNFSQIYAKYFGTTLKYLDRESKYFEVAGPHGGPVISEGVQILQHYSGPGGTISGGSIFFVTSIFPPNFKASQVGSEAIYRREV